MKARTVLLSAGDVDYAFGLSWHAARKGKGLRAECGRVARRERATHIVRAARQFGLADLGDARPTRGRPCRSAALAVAAVLDRSTYFAAFALEGGVYVTARVHGRVLADGDQFFTDDGAARAYYARYMAATEWAGALRLAPEEWEIQGTEESALDDVLASAGAVAALERPPMPRWWLGLAVIGAGVALAASAIALWPHEPKIRSVASYEEMPRSVQSFSAAVANCESAVSTVFRVHAVPGWDVTVWRCESGRLRASFERAKGMPRAWGLRDVCLTPNDSLDSGSCEIGVPPGNAVAIAPAELWGEREASLHVRVVTDTLGGSVTALAVAPPRLIGKGEPPPPPPPSWGRLSWSVKLGAGGRAWVTALGAMPATTLDRWETKGNELVVQGTTLVRRGR